MKLERVVQALERIAPLKLAAEWDNVGLLVQPRAAAEVRRILLTIDLTAAVMDEAVTQQCDLIVAYHPPIFSGLQRLTQSSAHERTVLRAIASGIAIYSPHTAIDAVAGGVNDWLADGLGQGTRVAIQPATQQAMQPAVQNAKTKNSAEGQGRLVHLDRAVRLDVLLARIKRHLKISTLRVALPAQGKAEFISTIALCAGAGGSVIGQVEADVLFTGEMRHHDVLAAVECGVAVVLTEHSNSERGYLPHLARRLQKDLGKAVEVRAARKDCEPLVIF